MNRSIRFITFICLILCVFCSNKIIAQGITFASGVIKDSITGEPLSYVSILFKGTTIGTMSDDNGVFALSNSENNETLLISSLGYNLKELTVPKGKKKLNLEILISQTSFGLEEIVIKPKQEKYTRKNNPAVALIKQVIAHKSANRIEAIPDYSVEKYEKLTLSLDNFNPNLDKNKFLRKFNFIKNYLDTSEFTGKPILTLSIRETLMDSYYRKNPKSEKNIIKAKRMQGVEESLDDGGITANLEEIFKSVNVFDNNITLLLNRFVSPLSTTLAVSYYKYYIMDTVMVGTDRCIDLSFVPVSSESYGFTGRLYITTDGRYAVKKVLLNVPTKINLNWVEKLRITQEFKQLPDSTWAVSEENTMVNFSLIDGTQAIYAHKQRNYNKYRLEAANDSIYKLLGKNNLAEDGIDKPDTYWIQNRPEELNNQEDAIGAMLAEFKRIPVFNVLIKGIQILVSGHIQTALNKKNSKFDFGPMNTTFGGNSIEGFRMRLGGMTTANLNEHIFGEGYLAYGTRDEKFKYNATGIYSFNKKRYHSGEYMRNRIMLSHTYDLYTPGQNFMFTSKDNVVLAIKVGMPITKYSYMRKTSLVYEKEWNNGLSIKTWAQHLNDEPTGTLKYEWLNSNNQLIAEKSLTTVETGAQLRFAPGERPYDGRAGQGSVFNLSKDAPVFMLSHQVGFKGVLGGEYNYNHTEMSAEKRVWLSSFGHIDAKVKAGKIWDKVPFPLLILPNANQSLILQSEAFHLMNALEFVSDEYISWDVTYFMKGLILNRIPLIKYLKLREVVSFHGIYGKLTDKNNPSISPELFILPEGTQPLGNTPYMECSVGLENIFKVVRVDYFRRLSYLDVPGIKKHGVRISMKFSF